MLKKNIQIINSTNKLSNGIDILIISTHSLSQEKFWQKALDKLRAVELKSTAIILCVAENWPGGAGNGLGTLYAYQQARKKAQSLYGIDILSKQEQGASIAIYHTAGEGKRLSPLTISEYNNKSAVKLPAFWQRSDPLHQLSLLEATIKQTSIYAQSLQGRIGVFWGDQIFIPSNSCQGTPQHHIELLTISRPMPNLKEWTIQKLNNYGIAVRDRNNQIKHLDKVDYGTLSQFVSPGQSFALSLGSFSLSSAFLKALLQEFDKELNQKQGKMDTDPFFWMPLTLDFEEYERLMHQRNITSENIPHHYERMSLFRKRFMSEHRTQSLFGIVDLGADTYWWDYGNIETYFHNNLKLISNSTEGKLLREFYSIPENQFTCDLQVDQSIVLNSHVKSGKIKNSIVIGVTADYLDISNSLILNTHVQYLEANRSLLYNVREENRLLLDKNSVRADVNIPLKSNPIAFYTELNRDGKKDWDIVLPYNSLSYAEAVFQIA